MGISANFRFIATTVPGILILGGILILILSPTPMGLDPVAGWVLIAIGVILYLLEFFGGVRRG